MNSSATTAGSMVLVGLMGTGKTTTARALAKRLSIPMTDSDVYLREHYRSSAAQMAVDEGVDVLHDREAEHVLDALTRTPRIVAAGASVVEYPEVRQALRQVFVAWLDASDEILRQRVRASAHRPGFDPATMRERRGGFYAEVADVRVDVSVNQPQQTVDLVLEALAAR